MGGSPLANAGSFLISVAFGFYMLVVLLRFLFQYFRVDFYNPVSRFVVTLTDPVLRPLRRRLPGWRGLDVASLVLLLVLSVLEQWLLLLVHGFGGGPLGLLVLGLVGVLRLLLNLYFWAILIQVVISWVNPGLHNPVTHILYRLVEPVLEPARRLLPPISGIDLSPVLVLLLIQLTKILLIVPLLSLGARLL